MVQWITRAATAALALLISGATTSAAIGVVDTFDDANLSEYSLTKVLDQGAGTSNVSFSSPSGAIVSSSAGTTGAEQALFLRSDVSLAVGEVLLADVVGNFATGFDRDLGIAVGYTATPAGLGNPQAGDVRSSYVEVSFRSNNQVVSFSRNGGANLASGQEFAGTPYGGATFNTVDPISLYISRLTANTFEVGWAQNGVRHAVTNNGAVIAPYTITDANVPGAAVGLYTDLRADLAATPVTLDNLRIEAIPEPTSMAMMGVAGLLALRRRRA